MASSGIFSEVQARLKAMFEREGVVFGFDTGGQITGEEADCLLCVPIRSQLHAGEPMTMLDSNTEVPRDELYLYRFIDNAANTAKFFTSPMKKIYIGYTNHFAPTHWYFHAGSDCTSSRVVKQRITKVVNTLIEAFCEPSNYVRIGDEDTFSFTPPASTYLLRSQNYPMISVCCPMSTAMRFILAMCMDIQRHSITAHRVTALGETFILHRTEKCTSEAFYGIFPFLAAL